MSDNTVAAIDYTGLTAEIIAAYVSNNPVPASELGSVITSVHSALSGIGSGGGSVATHEQPVEKPTPAAIRKSITPDALISFLDGKPYKTLRRHLSTRYNMTPEDYKARFGLPHDYPMVAPNYAEQRSRLARELGLGKLGGRARAAEPEVQPEPAPVAEAKGGRGRGGRRKSAENSAAAA